RMTHVHRTGFTQLQGKIDAREGIIFVHGLRGHPKTTWESGGVVNTTDEHGTAPKQRTGFRSLFRPKRSTPNTSPSQAQHVSSSPTVFWPEDYLTEDIPEARVWTYGYNADVIGGMFQANNQNSVSQHGRDLKAKLEREVDNQDPIIFVVHSLGGIIVKDMLHRSESCQTRTQLIIFLGTPHRGSSFSGWGQIASNLARLALQDSNKNLIETLEVNSEVLDNIHEEFKTVIHLHNIKVHSFQEARGISGMKVDDFSSKLDLPQSLETVESIDANHMEMARCTSKTDERYRAVVGVLKQSMRTNRAPETCRGIPTTAAEADGKPVC
ncbi:hypothetical protein LX36DRAFT_592390, partial [Colletotrichum falcatum]